jgi:hypothetical protein
MNWFTKKGVFICSIISSLLFIILYFNVPYSFFCKDNRSLLYCGDFFRVLKILFMITPAILFLSIINFFVSDRIFLSWKKFTFIYLLIYLLIIIIAPATGGDFIKIVKGTLGIFLSIVYFIISLFLILHKSFKKD